MAVWPAWEVREDDGATSWHTVRLSFPDGACGEVLAVVSAGRVSVEDVRAQPALSLVDLTMLADWIEGPLFETCGGGAPEADAGAEALEETRGPHRARPAWPRGVEGRRLVAQEYRAAREEGVDPVPRGHVRDRPQPPQVPAPDRAGAGRRTPGAASRAALSGPSARAAHSIPRIRVISVVCSATTSSAISSMRMLFPCALTSAAMVMAPS